MLRRGIRTRLRRLIALGSATLLAAGVLSAATVVTTTVPATAAPAPFSCDAFGYLFQTPDTGVGTEVDRIDLATGQATTVGTFGDSVNAVAYNTLDNLFYAYDGTLGKVVTIDSNLTVTPVANPPVAGVIGWDMADFDPATGDYWVSNGGGKVWAEMNFTPGSPSYGSTITSGTLTDPAGLRGGVDWSFIGNRLYRVMQEDTPGASDAHLVSFNPKNGTEADLGDLGFTVDTKVGATFTDSAGNLYSSDNGDGAIWRVKAKKWVNNPAANQPFHVSTGPQSGNNDGARCADAPIPTLTVAKQVAGRVSPSDQFTVALKNSGGTTLDSATTLGTQTSASTTDVPVTQGASFTITDAMANGSANPLSDYTPTISCQDTNGGADPPVSGSAPTWTVTVTNATYYACTVTNTPKAPKAADLSITKTGPATIDANGTITWQLTVTNNGPDTSPGATVTDDVPAGVINVKAAGCTVAGSAVSCAVGTLANGAAQPFTITGTAPANYSACITNTASVKGQLAEPPNATGPNSASWQTCTNGPQLDVAKTAQTSTGTDNAPPGSVIKYTISVTNPGPGLYTTADPATISDDLSGVLDDATLVAGNLSATEGTPSISGNTLSWSGTPAVNTPVLITYSVTVNDPATGDGDISNVVTSVNHKTCAPGDCPGTHDYKPLLSVTKTAQTADGSANAQPGSVVKYTITLKNNGTGDWTTTTPAAFTDDLSGVLDDAHATTAPDNGASISATTLSWSGPLAHGATLVITYAVTVNLPDTGDHTLVNAINSKNHQNCPPANCPPPVTLYVPLLSVTKTAQTADGTTNAQPGSVVKYTITLKNNGTGDWTTTTPAAFTDDMSGVLDDAHVTTAPNYGASISGNTLSWSGALAHGATLQITYAVTVNLPDNGDHNLVNAINSINLHDCPPESCPPPTTNPVPDLQVTKTVDTNNAPPGTVVNYTITLFNNGAGDWTTTTPAAFTDDMSGVLDDAHTTTAPNNGASISGNTLSWSGALAHGATLVITYAVTVNNPDLGDHDLVNAINSINLHDCPPESCPPPTQTHVPDLHVTKVASRANAAPGTTVSYTITVTNTGTAAWTAGHPAQLVDNLSKVLDDADLDGAVTTSKTKQGARVPDASFSAPNIAWSGPLAVGDSFTITYTVRVHNPDTGDHDIDNAVVANAGNCVAGSTDPSCVAAPKVPDLHIVKQVSSADAAPGSTVTYTVSVENSGLGAWTADEPASLTDELSKVLDDADLGGQVRTSKTQQGATVPNASYASSTISWSGPLAAGDSFTISYSVKIENPDASGDHVMTNLVTAVTGNCAAGSTDPACATQTLIPDMAVTKTASSTDASPGSTVDYTIIVANNGTGAWTAGMPASLSDDLSSVLDDGVYNKDAAASATAHGATVPAPSYTAPTISWSGPLAAGDSFTITYSVTVDNPDTTGDHLLTNAVLPRSGACVDPTSPGCSTTTKIPDMTVTKVASTSDAAPGTTVNYTITVTNSGTGDWTDTMPASLTDSLSGVLDDAVYNNDLVASGTVDGATVPAPGYSAPTISWSGPLAAGDSFMITYSVTVDNPDTTGDHLLQNAVLSKYGPCVDPTQPGCSSTTEIPDMAVTKVASTTDAAPGSTVDYTITVTNSGTGDWTDTMPASLSDDLSGVLDDAVYNNDAAASATADGATVPAPAYTEPTISWSGPLVAGDSFTITYSVTINNPDATGDHLLQNAALSKYGPCVDPTSPGCSSTTEIPDMAVTKVASTADAAPGSTVGYTITVSNPGTGDWTDTMPASFTDDLTQVLDDATWNDDLAATTGATAPAPTYSEPVISWSGPLVAGASFTVTYSVTINNPDTGDHSMTNVVEAPVGNCLTGSTDPTCGFTTLVPDLHVVKNASATTVGLDGKLGYTLTITNPGKGDWTDTLPATATDDLSDVLDDATYDKDAKASAGTATLTDKTLTWTGPLAAGDTVSVIYSVTVNDHDTGNHRLDNHVSTKTGNCDPEPTNPDCNTSTPVAAYVLTKISDPKSGTTVHDGQHVSYTVTVQNTGKVDLTPKITDDLSKVLDDASYDDNATASAGTVTRSGKHLAWSLPLPIGAKATLMYSVTVSGNGDHNLVNVVSGDGPLASCGGGQSVCTTHNPDPAASGLAFTGTAAVPAQLLGGLLLLLLGAAALVAGRRLRRGRAR